MHLEVALVRRAAVELPQKEGVWALRGARAIPALDVFPKTEGLPRPREGPEA